MEGFTEVGWRIELIVMAAVAATLLLTTIITALVEILINRKYYGAWKWDAVSGWLIAVSGFTAVSFATLIVALIPFDASYHFIYQTEAKVQSVISSASESTAGVIPQYVIESDSVKGSMVFADPRILVEEGEIVKMRCTLEWVPLGSDRLNCWIAPR